MEEISFVSNYDGLKLSAAECAVRNPRAVVQIVHGMSEHKERYYPFMEFLAEHGIASVADDHRGHGASAPCREDLGYFGPGGAEALLSDIHQITAALRGAYPGKPLFLLGHSMGALTVRSYIQRWGREIDGLIVSGNPGWNPSAPMGLRIAPGGSAAAGQSRPEPVSDHGAIGSISGAIREALYKERVGVFGRAGGGGIQRESAVRI